MWLRLTLNPILPKLVSDNRQLPVFQLALLREEKSFSQRAFSIYTDIRKLQDKGNSIRTPREIDFVVNLGGKRTYIQLAYVKILDSVNPKSMRLLSEISIPS